MKKTIHRLVEQLQENPDGTLKQGFASIKGGLASLRQTNSGVCVNDGNCTSSNTHQCDNSGNCTGTSNSGNTCTNQTTCFS